MTETRTVCVRLFAIARQLAGREEIALHLPPSATIANLRAALAAAEPKLAPVLPHVLFSINAEYANDRSLIPADAEIACIPPVSGG